MGRRETRTRLITGERGITTAARDKPGQVVRYEPIRQPALVDGSAAVL